jgi:hypothetical protein
MKKSVKATLLLTCKLITCLTFGTVPVLYDDLRSDIKGIERFTNFEGNYYYY